MSRLRARPAAFSGMSWMQQVRTRPPRSAPTACSQPSRTTSRARLEKLMPGGVLDYGIRYGTLSDIISCNAKAVAKCPTTPAEFFDTTNFPGKRIMNGVEPMVAMAFALAADGVPYDQIYPMDIDRAFKNSTPSSPTS